MSSNTEVASPGKKSPSSWSLIRTEGTNLPNVPSTHTPEKQDATNVVACNSLGLQFPEAWVLGSIYPVII